MLRQFDLPSDQLLGDSHPNKCPRCGGAMVCYVSSPIAPGRIERRLYYSCQCGMIAAVNEEDVLRSQRPQPTRLRFAMNEPVGPMDKARSSGHACPYLPRVVEPIP